MFERLKGYSRIGRQRVHKKIRESFDKKESKHISSHDGKSTIPPARFFIEGTNHKYICKTPKMKLIELNGHETYQPVDGNRYYIKKK